MTLRRLIKISRSAQLLGQFALLVQLLVADAPIDTSLDRSDAVTRGLTRTLTTEHFVLHFSPSQRSPEPTMTIAQYTQAGAEDFEEAYRRLVDSGGSGPTAGFRRPIPDDDGRIDVYLISFASPEQLGDVRHDASPRRSAFIRMSVAASRYEFRWTAAHELMHLIQLGYHQSSTGVLAEAFAEWAAEHAFADINPPRAFLDPSIPIDCVEATWRGLDCGSGYSHWLFIQAQVEDFGVDFVKRFYEGPTPPSLSASAADALERAITMASGGTSDLSARFAAYARDLWVPARWTSDAVGSLHSLGLSPERTFVSPGIGGSDWRHVDLDHLTAAYVEIADTRGAPQGAGVRISWTVPLGMTRVVPLVERGFRQGRWSELDAPAASSGSVTVRLGAGDRIVLPLINDSLTADAQPFAFRVSFL